jgi:hypothetical protein
MATDSDVYAVMTAPRAAVGPFESLAAARSWAALYNATLDPTQPPAFPIALDSPEVVLRLRGVHLVAQNERAKAAASGELEMRRVTNGDELN